MAESADEYVLEELEREFQQVLGSLASDRTLDRFREEYEKVFKALRRSHDTERRLVRKVKQLNTEIVSNATKVTQALKLSEEDATTIDELKKQVERAWTMVEAANTREEAANATIERQSGELAQLTLLVQKQTAMLGADTSLEDLIAARDTLAARLREAEAAVAVERARADELTAEVTLRAEKAKERKAHIKELEREIKNRAADEAREAKKRAVMEADMAKLRDQLAAAGAAAATAQKKAEEAEEKSGKLEKQLAAQRFTMTQSLGDFQKLQASTTKLAEQLDEALMRSDALTDEKAKVERELKAAREEVAREKAVVVRAASKADADAKERERLARIADDEKLEVAKVRAELAAVRKELESEIMRFRGAERTVARLDRERAAAEKRVATEASRLADAAEEADAKTAEVAALEAENRRLLAEATKMRTVISVLERDREKIRQQTEDLESRWRQAEETTRMRESQIADMEKKESEVAARLKQSQTMYEIVRGDRNTIAKQLTEAQNEMSELRRKAKVQSSQVEQLKDDVHAKDRALVAEQFEHQAVEKRLEQRTHEVEQLKRLLDEANMNVTKQDNEIGELASTIRRLDAEALAQKRAYDQVVTERDILGTQLIRRNDELALLYEKLAIQASTLSKGEAQYKERLDDIRLLKIRVADLKRELAVATGAASGSTELRREVSRLQRELLQEQTKVKALSEELENPMNVHRWRKLEGSDPATYEMIQKITTLQRRLIAKTEEVVERDMLLSEKEKLAAELKAMLSRLPGPEVAEQLAHYQHLLNERTRQLKALASELNMFQAQITEYKEEIDRANREALENKRMYYEVKKRERKPHAGLLEDENGHGQTAATGTEGLDASSKLPPVAQQLAQQQRQAAQAAAPRFVGDGFYVHA